MPEDQTQREMYAITARIRDMVDQFQRRDRARAAGLVLAPETSAKRAREFAEKHDVLTKRFMALFPDMTSADWELFADFLPNVKKFL